MSVDAVSGARDGRQARPLRVMIAEDSVLLREGLVGLLNRFAFTVTATVGDVAELLTVIPADCPDVVIMDVRMPPTFTDEGLKAAIRLRGDYPDLGILVLSQYVETEGAEELMTTGMRGVGYLLKDRIGAVTEFADAVKQVATGGTVIDPDVVYRLVRDRAPDPIASLTPREREVLTFIAEGRTNTAIADRLYLSEAAIAKHVTGIYTKLNLGPDTNDHRRVLAALTYLSLKRRRERD